MDIPLQYNIDVIGADKIAKAFSTIEKSVKSRTAKMERDLTKQSIASETKLAQERLKSETKLQQERIKGENKIAQMRLRDEQRLSQKRISNADREAKAQARAYQKVVFDIGKTLGQTIKYSLAGVTAGLTAMGISSVKSGLENSKSATIFANRAKATPEERRAIRADAINATKQLAGKYGVDKADAMGFLTSFQGMGGSPRQALDLLPQLGEYAAVQGMNVNDLSGAAAEAARVVGDSGLTGDKANQAVVALMKSLGEDAVNGNMDMSQISKNFARVLGAGALVGGDPTAMIGSNVGLMQMSRYGGAASSDEQGTALAAFARDTRKNEKKLGVSVMEKDGKTQRSLEDIAIDVLKKTNGKLQGLNLGEESMKVLTGAAKIFNDAGGGASGEKAVREKIAFLGKGGVSEKEYEDKKKLLNEDPSVKMARNMERLNNAMADKLIPVVVDKLIPGFERAVPIVEKLIDKFGGLVEFIANNPFSSLGIVIAGYLTKEIAAAKIGSVLTGMIGRMFGGGGGMPGMPGGGMGGPSGGPGGVGGAVSGGVGMTVAAGAVALNQGYQFGKALGTDLYGAMGGNAEQAKIEAERQQVAIERERIAAAERKAQAQEYIDMMTAILTAIKLNTVAINGKAGTSH